MVHLLLAIIYLSFIGPYVMGYMLNGGYHWTVGYFASMFFIGITVGRAINGFLSLKLNDTQLIRLGQVIIAIGIIALVLPWGNSISLAGFIMIGLGCAPIYPCVIHSIPNIFGAERSQAIIGVQMASAYVGNI